MAVKISNKSFLTLLDFSPKEIRFLLDLSKKLKADKRKGNKTKTNSFVSTKKMILMK